MRTKRLYLIIAFADMTDAMHMEACCHREGLPGRLIPLPPELAAGCGLAWCTETAWQEALLERMVEWSVQHETMAQLLLWQI